MERRLCALTQDLQIFKKFYMCQMNTKEFVHNTAHSVQLLRRSVHFNFNFIFVILKQLHKYLMKLLKYKLSQDHLEHFFGLVWS